jgi:adenosylcobinamide-GDP ribazoletransferase
VSRGDQPEAEGTDGGAPQLAGWRALAADGAAMIRFYSRLPMPRLPFEAEAHAPPDFRRAPRMLPLAGLVIGLPGALVLALCAALGLPPLVAAALAVAAAVLATGAFHEDGLADTFDGLGGGWTPERRLEIMKDSRIGSYGGAALMLALIARVACLAALIERGGLPAAATMLAAAALSRPIALLPLALLPPARPDGASALVGRPSRATVALAIGLGLLLSGLLAALAGASVAGAGLGLALGLASAWVLTRWSARAIGGQTGDVAGACQQLAEIAIYVGMLMVLSHEHPISLHQGLQPR